MPWMWPRSVVKTWTSVFAADAMPVRCEPSILKVVSPTMPWTLPRNMAEAWMPVFAMDATSVRCKPSILRVVRWVAIISLTLPRKFVIAQKILLIAEVGGGVSASCSKKQDKPSLIHCGPILSYLLQMDPATLVCSGAYVLSHGHGHDDGGDATQKHGDHDHGVLPGIRSCVESNWGSERQLIFFAHWYMLASMGCTQCIHIQSFSSSNNDLCDNTTWSSGDSTINEEDVICHSPPSDPLSLYFSIYSPVVAPSDPGAGYDVNDSIEGDVMSHMSPNNPSEMQCHCINSCIIMCWDMRLTNLPNN